MHMDLSHLLQCEDACAYHINIEEQHKKDIIRRGRVVSRDIPEPAKNTEPYAFRLTINTPQSKLHR